MANENHHLPKFLQRGWEAQRGIVWVFDHVKQTIELKACSTVGVESGAESTNLRWSRFEGAAAKEINSLRKSPGLILLTSTHFEPLRNLKRQHELALHAVFWTLAMRSPDIAPIDRVDESALLDALESSDSLADLSSRYSLGHLRLAAESHPFVLGSHPAFRIRPHRGLPIFLLPFSPRRALVVAEQRIAQPDGAAWLGLDLGEVSCGTPSTFSVLPPELIEDDHTEVARKLGVHKRTWAPQIWRWGQELRRTDTA